ncbi:hypothetical protein AVEN_100420-1 [Araneus ventricosus]|uniref:Uncharacterized protein n=1 Tax=Araneus ventricosus TaxID=182803 RepID=A0A4Y2CYP4_ARAVE|nr:hypothetical protein AVEN_100420-1 [Araneus ventricosus]
MMNPALIKRPDSTELPCRRYSCMGTLPFYITVITSHTTQSSIRMYAPSSEMWQKQPRDHYYYPGRRENSFTYPAISHPCSGGISPSPRNEFAVFI